MNRRDATLGLGAAGLLLAAGERVTAQPVDPARPAPSFAMLVYPKMILLDLTGPLTVFNLTMGKTHLVWKDKNPVSTDVGISVAPTTTFAECPRDVDVLFVPGGLAGTTALLDDSETLAFLSEMGAGARFVTSVCTGSLALGAAGLLTGRRATSHWYTRELLPLFGATRSDERVVEDGNLITGGGVTAGIDFGLTISARLRGEEWAKRTQLTLEYDPQPPFVGGSPAKAGPDATGAILRARSKAIAMAREASERAAAKLRG